LHLVSWICSCFCLLCHFLDFLFVVWSIWNL
jgi:hypothetical protein